MSALGHKRTLKRLHLMSALPPKADIKRRSAAYCTVGNHANLALGECPRRRSGMSDLHEARNPEREPQIDTIGWLFLAFAVAITATAGMIAYKATDTMVANAPVSHVVAR